MSRGARKLKRKDMQKKSNSVHSLELKMGKYRDEMTALEKETTLLSTTMDEVLTNLKKLFELDIIKKAVEAEKDLEECPSCGKKFKQLSKHKCKV